MTKYEDMRQLPYPGHPQDWKKSVPDGCWFLFPVAFDTARKVKEFIRENGLGMDFFVKKAPIGFFVISVTGLAGLRGSNHRWDCPLYWTPKEKSARMGNNR